MDDLLPDIDPAAPPRPLKKKRRGPWPEAGRKPRTDGGRFYTHGPEQPNHRHHRLAALAACGKSNIDIAREIGWTPQYVSKLLLLPSIRALVQQYHHDFFQEAAQSLKEEISLEGHASLEVVKELRDGAANEGVRLKAAQDLLDRNPASAAVSKREEDRTIRIMFSREDQRDIGDAMREMKVIEAEGRLLE